MVLPNGNIVVTDSSYSIPGGAANVGAVYLYSPGGVLISRITGSSADDRVGSYGITILANGNFVIRSPDWKNGTATSAGAVTWASAVTGVSGVVSAENSLVGSSTDDRVGYRINSFNGVVPLKNGHYLVRTPAWDRGTIVDAGAVTWGSGTAGVAGIISPELSLVGAHADDKVGEEKVVELANGHYVVSTPFWDDGAKWDVGAVTWGNGMSGVKGEISVGNSLIGNNANDEIGGEDSWGGIFPLSNGDYVVTSPHCANPNSTNTPWTYALYAGAVTGCNGSTGTVGVVTVANSLMGNRPNDNVGRGGVYDLGGGRFVTYTWDLDAADSLGVGAVTWCASVASTVGLVSSANSLLGARAGDAIGSGGITVLKNGNYLISSPSWDKDGSTQDVGAVTWVDGNVGLIGTVSAANSLVGNSAGDEVGEVTELSNGHYVVASYQWSGPAEESLGAVTWCDGLTGLTGEVTAANSIIGATANDRVGRVHPLTNGNYVINCPNWNHGEVQDVGAVTWCSGSGPTSAIVSAANSLIGSRQNDFWSAQITALSNGNYVVATPSWDKGTVPDVGAVTWGNGSTGVVGSIGQASLSLTGSSENDQVGSRLLALENGHYVVTSPNWATDDGYGSNLTVGAVTWCNGETGRTGVVSAQNSLVGESGADGSGMEVRPLPGGNYLVVWQGWDNIEPQDDSYSVMDAGAVTWCSGLTGKTGKVSATNSLVGNQNHFCRSIEKIYSDGSYVVNSTRNTGPIGGSIPISVTFGDPSGTTVGEVDFTNSIIDHEDLLFGYSLDYDVVRRQHVVGRYFRNLVTLYKPNARPPSVQKSSTALLASAGTLVIQGTGFSSVSGDNSVTFNQGATAVVSAATVTQLTLTSLTGLVAGPLTAVVRTNGLSSGSAVQIATVVPTLTASEALLPITASQIILHGHGFSPTASQNIVTLNGGVKGTVVSATKTQLTVNLSSLVTGPLTAGVKVNGIPSPGTVSVARVAPVITERTVNVAQSTTTLTIHGRGFSTTPAQNSVTLSSGASAVVISSTATQLVLGELTGLPLGPLTARVTTNGVQNEAPVQIATLIPPATGTIAFESALYRVNQGAVSVQLRLIRTGGDEATGVTLLTQNGLSSRVPPFSAALSGKDYEALSGFATTVDFAAGEVSKTVDIILKAQSGTSVPNKRFSASLNSPVAGAELGSITTTSIQILAQDSKRPTLKLVKPGSTGVSALSPYVISGIVGDSKGVDRVEVTLNDGAPTPAILGYSKYPTSVPFSLAVSPVLGINTLVVDAFDLRGNSTRLTRQFQFTQRYQLSVRRLVPDDRAATPDSVGTVILAASPKASASALSPTTAQANPRISQVEPGTAIQLTAVAKTGYVFSHWDQTLESTILGNWLTATMPVQDTEISAVFVASPFLTADGSGSDFQGSLSPSTAEQSSVQNEAFIRGTVVPSTGAFSGKILHNGRSTSFTAQFYGDGKSTFTTSQGKVAMLTIGEQALDLTLDAGVIQATLTSGSVTSMGLLRRSTYSKSRKVPLTGAVVRGTYHLVFPAKVQVPEMLLEDYPQGSGYATLKLSETGAVTLTGVLADGTLLTAGSGMVNEKDCRLYAQILTPGTKVSEKGGLFRGALDFSTQPADTDVTGTDWLWLRPEVSELSGSSSTAKATQIYTKGWPGGISADALGTLYRSTSSLQNTLALGPKNPTSGNATLLFSAGKLISDVTVSALNIATSKITKIPTSNASFTLSLSQSTGLMKGTFSPNWPTPSSSKPQFRGILLQKGTNRMAQGFFLSNATGDTNPESGQVILIGVEQPITIDP